MNKYYARRKCKEISRRVTELNRRLESIARYCQDENEYYDTWEWKEMERLMDKQAQYEYECN